MFLIYVHAVKYKKKYRSMLVTVLVCVSRHTCSILKKALLVSGDKGFL